MAKRAMSSQKASYVKISGHKKELEFANLIGLGEEYKNDKKAKKDVIDHNGDAHSIKSGQQKWQIFLYGANRLATDYGFLAMNGMGQLLKDCLEVFPNDRDLYLKDKATYKNLLQTPMKNLCDKLKDINRRKAFFSKAFFNGGEVQFLTIFSPIDNKVRVFHHEDVVDILAAKMKVENSKARLKHQFDAQKVVFKNGKSLGEIEIRNDSEQHYREVKFWMNAKGMLNLLIQNIPNSDMPKSINQVKNTRIVRYGKAVKRFK